MRQTAEQSAIIDAGVGEDLLVVAGAGSGKTMTMTQRIIALIEKGVPSEQILGLTFTRKAASELLSRVSAAVIRNRPGSQSGAVDPERNFLKPSVFTYDAFFQSIVRQYGLLVGMDQDTQPLSAPGAFQLAAGVVADHIDLVFPDRREVMDQAEGGLDVDDPLSGFSAATIGGPDQAARLARIRAGDQDDVGSGTFETTVNQVLGITRALTSSMISRDCPDFDRALARVRAWDQAFIDRTEALIDGRPIPDAEPSDPSMNRPKRAKKDSDEDYALKLEKMRKKRLDFRLYQANRLLRTARTREKLLTLADYYQKAKRQANMAEFGDFTLAAFQLVDRFPSIGAHYRRRFTHVFLDEYQDTSTTQALLLAAIFHPEDRTGESDESHPVSQDRPDGWEQPGDQAHPGGYAPVDGLDDRNRARSHPSRSAVTAVGDPFQSIYAWRGASPGAFRTFQSQFGMLAEKPTVQDGRMGGVATFGRSGDQDPLTLSRTFRNSRMVLRAANLLTVPLRQETDRFSSARMDEVDVARLEARDDADQGTIGLLGYSTIGQEIDAVVRFALHARSRYGKPGTDGRGEDPDAPHVAVLFRSKSRMPQYREALESAGLTCQVVGYSALFDLPEVMDLLALLRVICDHTDSSSLMRLLASARFNMNPADLSALASLAETINTDSRYRALLQAGLVPETEDRQARKDLVREHRNQVPNSLFLIDLLLRDDLADLLRTSRLSPRGRTLATRAAEVIRRVQAQSSAPLRQVVIAAIQALDLDIDLVLSRAMDRPDQPLQPSQANTGIEALLDQVDTYVSELPAGLGPSLPGFVAWVDAMVQSPDLPDTGIDNHADVALMTIHQAKGLEWDAVAVVGLSKGAFPSSQGDHLKIQKREDGASQGGQEGASPSYLNMAHTWLEDPQAVPVPVRADAMILPRFPHDARPGSEPGDDLGGLDLAALEDEAIGGVRATGVDDEGEPCDFLDKKGYLSQKEEYGNRYHNDERRLAYVAVTRARHDLLLTFGGQTTDTNPALNTPQVDAEAEASNFWLELVDGLRGDSEAIRLDPVAGDQEPDEGAVCPPTPPVGLLLGQDAGAYRDALVGEALDQVDQLAARRDGTDRSFWPVAMGSKVGRALRRSAEWVGPDTDPTGTRHGEGSLYADAVQVLQVDTGRLGVTGDRLVTDLDVLRRTGRGIISHGAQSVTSIQTRSGTMDAARERDYWEGLVRPVPRVASPLAQAGTLFHDWAQRFILPDLQNSSGLLDVADQGGGGSPDESSVQSGPDGRLIGSVGPLGPEALAERRRMVTALDSEEDGMGQAVSDRAVAGQEASGRTSSNQDASNQDAPVQSPDGKTARRLRIWERRLAESDWARRTPAWVERPIVAVLEGTIVKGKLDAVFRGGLDQDDGSRLYTIVDWKTGARPRTEEETSEKLAQLDLYRILLSRLEGIDLSSIDACLYYVSEAQPSRRLIRARPRTQEEILRGLRRGVPQESDND